MNTVKSHRMNIVYSYLTHDACVQLIETRNWTFLRFKDISLFVLSHVSNRQRFPLAAQYNSPSTLYYRVRQNNASSYLT